MPATALQVDESTFHAYIEKYAVDLCRRWRIPRGEVDDVVQEVWTEILASLASFRPDGDFSNWTRGIAWKENTSENPSSTPNDSRNTTRTSTSIPLRTLPPNDTCSAIDRGPFSMERKVALCRTSRRGHSGAVDVHPIESCAVRASVGERRNSDDCVDPNRSNV
jgi:hypothetical protein